MPAAGQFGASAASDGAATSTTPSQANDRHTPSPIRARRVVIESSSGQWRPVSAIDRLVILVLAAYREHGTLGDGIGDRVAQVRPADVPRQVVHVDAAVGFPRP